MIFGLSPGDKVAIEFIKWISAIVIVVSPWIFLRLENKIAKIALTGLWILGILTLSLLYLGLLVDSYLGPQLGFNENGNPMNWFMIMIGLLSAAPFAFTAYNGNLKKPIRSSMLIGVALLILIGPAVFNSVAFTVYTQEGGEWKCGDDPMYGCEVDIPTQPEDWDMAQNLGLVVCNLLPASIVFCIWFISRRMAE
ncbi:MAG: hypothetical protein CMB31_06355 [Euryarchaeota archaeon]|nr:hypothetical protein [Euryarchaeota archaeon]|tara:strand:+ start:16 stop:600 length:585 start_codon:yes stop_codon:yes gene_type:complete